MNTTTMFSSKSSDWSTPQEFYDKLDAEFGFVLDPCASDENAKCAVYYTERDNGLGEAWFGPVFMNPPYGRQIGHWVKRAYQESDEMLIVALLPARTDTKWFHDYIYGKAEIRFVKGRLKFGGSKNSAPFPSMVVIWRPTHA